MSRPYLRPVPAAALETEGASSPSTVVLSPFRCTLPAGHAGACIHDPAQNAGGECNGPLPSSLAPVPTPLLGPGDRHAAHEPALPLELTVAQLEALLRDHGYLRHSCRMGGGVVLVSAETRDGRVVHADGRDLVEAWTRLVCLGGRTEVVS